MNKFKIKFLYLISIFTFTLSMYPQEVIKSEADNYVYYSQKITGTITCNVNKTTNVVTCSIKIPKSNGSYIIRKLSKGWLNELKHEYDTLHD